MFYEFQLLTPANTPETTPIETRVKLQGGVITKAFIQFPAGCAGLAKFKCKIGNYNLWPRNETGYIAADNYVVPIDEYYELKTGINTLRFLTWNEDDTYDHTISVKIIVLPPWLANPYTMFDDIRSALILLLRRIGVVR